MTRQYNRRVSLAEIMQDLINRSLEDRQFHAKTLGRGLVVSLCVSETYCTLACWRTDGSQPSEVEWATLLKYLPDAYKPMQKIIPTDYQEGPRVALRDTWQIGARLL